MLLKGTTVHTPMYLRTVLCNHTQFGENAVAHQQQLVDIGKDRAILEGKSLLPPLGV